MDQELADADTYLPGRCTHQTAALFAWNDVMAAICKVLRHIGNPIRFRQLMHIYLNNPAKFHPDPILNNTALGFFEKHHHNKKNKKKNKVTSDMGSAPGPENKKNKTSVCHVHTPAV